MTDSVLIFLGLQGCSHCDAMEERWSDIKRQISKVYPKMKFIHITASKPGVFKTNVPEDLKFFSQNWAPMFLLVSYSDYRSGNIKNTAKIMNATWRGSSLEYKAKYSMDDKGFLSWLRSI